jgi:hypothetical protein
VKKKFTDMALIPASKKTQLDLFQTFLCNTNAEKQELSNAINLWDILPLYSMSRQAMTKMRDERGFLGLKTFNYTYHNREIEVEIQPALISEKNKDGETITNSYYPSATEELIEAVLRKLAITGAVYDQSTSNYGVQFSLHKIRAELLNYGHSHTLDEIKQALEILTKSVIRIKGEGLTHKAAKFNPYLPNLTLVSRKDLAIDPDAINSANFNPFVSHAIEQISYRQFNFDRLMKHHHQLTRWLHKYLIDLFQMAAHTKNFKILFSTIKEKSAILDNYADTRLAIKKCDESFQELVTNNVLLKFEKSIERGARNKIINVTYSMYATDDFIAEIKAAHKRLGLARTKLIHKPDQ